MKRLLLAPLLLALGLSVQAEEQKPFSFPTVEEAKGFQKGPGENCKGKKDFKKCMDDYPSKRMHAYVSIDVLCGKYKDSKGCHLFENYYLADIKNDDMANLIRKKCKSRENYLTCARNTEEREKSKLEINKNKEKLVLIYKCKDKFLCQFPGDGDLYIDKNSFKVTSDNVTIHNQREYRYPNDIDGTKSKNQKFGVFGKIQTIGIDCKNKTKTSIISGKQKLLISKDATKEELQAYSSIPINDRIFELSCKDRKHPSIKKTANQIIYGNMDKIDKMIIDLQVNPNSKTKSNTKKSDFHEECKNSNDYLGCINYKENK